MSVLTAQAELAFAVPQNAPDAAWLEGVLRRGGGWMFAAELCRLAGLPETEDGKRWIRKLASESRVIISGQRGYRHLACATPAEISHCRNALRSQARELLRRYVNLGRAAHQVIG